MCWLCGDTESVKIDTITMRVALYCFNRVDYSTVKIFVCYQFEAQVVDDSLAIKVYVIRVSKMGI